MVIIPIACVSQVMMFLSHDFIYAQSPVLGHMYQLMEDERVYFCVAELLGLRDEESILERDAVHLGEVHRVRLNEAPGYCLCPEGWIFNNGHGAAPGNVQGGWIKERREEALEWI